MLRSAPWKVMASFPGRSHIHVRIAHQDSLSYVNIQARSICEAQSLEGKTVALDLIVWGSSFPTGNVLECKDASHL